MGENQEKSFLEIKKENIEWSERKKWNPFNSYKLLSQVYRWRLIKRGKPIPQPSLVTIDPTNSCNLDCIWCNSSSILKKSKSSLSKETMLKIADFLAEWQGNPGWEKGVESVCIAGGGEPLMNYSVGGLIDRWAEMGIDVGVVPNGTKIDEFIEPLSKCTWVGVSIDSASPETMKKLKGEGCFSKIIENIKELVRYSKKNNTRLSTDSQGYGVSYKYLLHQSNIHEIFDAAKIAKDIGCKNFHMRPAGVPWDKLPEEKGSFVNFTESSIEEFKKQVRKARELEDRNFGVFGITHKFDNKFKECNKFSMCNAVFMTAVFMPPTNSNESCFNLGVCCDRRGDSRLLLGENLESTEKIKGLWGSKKHWEIFDSIDAEKCPRCTYQPHNQIYEHVIASDNMTYKFI